MQDPKWEVLWIGGSGIIGITALVYALFCYWVVGGSLYLVWTERKARKKKAGQWLQVLQRQSQGLATGGGIGVGISGMAFWCAVSFAAPEIGRRLSSTFLFLLLTAWVGYGLVVLAGVAYASTWNRIPAALHLRIGWIYAISALLTLGILNGIPSFLLDPGPRWLNSVRIGQDGQALFAVYLTPVYGAGLLMRIAWGMAVAGIWAFFSLRHVGVRGDLDLRRRMIRWSMKWVMAGLVVGVGGLGWLFWKAPIIRDHLLELWRQEPKNGPLFDTLMGFGTGMVGLIGIGLGLAYWIGWRGMDRIRWGHGLFLAFIVIGSIGIGAFLREMLRKPFGITGFLYANGIRVDQVERWNREGYLSHSIWIPVQTNGQRNLGKAMFLGQCAVCHTINGYRGIRPFLRGWDSKAIERFLTRKIRSEGGSISFMPPIVGTAAEKQALQRYLQTLAHEASKSTPSSEAKDLQGT